MVFGQIISLPKWMESVALMEWPIQIECFFFSICLNECFGSLKRQISWHN